jgi:DNA-binding response OmpR family regulator
MTLDRLPFQRALLVEDEFNLATTLKISLKTLGLSEVIHCDSLEKARQEFEKARESRGQPFDLVVLDRGLPDGEGLDFCLELRSAGFLGVILVLTANGLVEERVRGLDAGADEYLAKPFSWEELVARLRALARREWKDYIKNQEQQQHPWTIDDKNLRVLGPKGWVTLTPLELKLFLNLYESRGNIVSRDELLKNVWGFKWLPKTRTVDFFMARLRRSFEPTPENPRHFLTIRGVGYKFLP